MKARQSHSRNVFSMEWMMLSLVSAVFALTMVSKLVASPVLDLATSTAGQMASVGPLVGMTGETFQ